MFDFLFPKKLTVSPIFEVLGTDMHSHLVPGVDDGSRSVEDTIQCLTTMYEVGYRRVVITPHFQSPRFPNKENDITNRFNELKKTLQERGIPMELAGIGGEYRVDDAFAARIEKPDFLQVAGQYILLELSLNQKRMGFEDNIFDLQMKGYDIILAHPERYPYYDIHSQKLQQLKEQGVFFQLNILSLSGFYGDMAQKKAFDYLDAGWVDFLGTDMHNQLYAKALKDASRHKKVQKVLEKHTFLNSKL